ncbi:collagenase. Unknown type peptidase. MEROPS family U32 [Mariniphaga anaerophila]|uniref:Protease n=1 Tax=Mariniphaga anaerophila TaxID=1484053 RepID=A0A1M5CXE4_9BACT|nr:peptidase U32 family protein [Mariniphaga anaerophila]SHF59287.1 collagenase. Unknown type peptidase. MEROPS family U32 [Mariniphaga anaerophila]
MEGREIEIMAPVGSYESLMAAIQGGAGSVYFGVEHLNMRSRSANNFTLDDLKKIVETATSHGVKTYLTLNVEIFDNEAEQMHAVLDAAKAAGVSAVIAADISVIMYARSIGLEVHISTQVNITNIDAVKFYSAFADVMVLAREMNLGRVWEISNQIKEQQIKGPSGNLVRLEMFVHGALCMAISGKCYLSLQEMNSSANRGSCLQTCRRAYTVTDKETGAELEIDNEYIMSPKDLKTIHFLNKVLDAGVSVLKIEGRARSPEYVKTTAECYHEAVQAYLEGTFTEEKIENWNERLAAVFNRGFWNGYYLGQRLGEWSANYGSRATKRKIYIGKCTNYFSNIKVAEFKLETLNLKTGDEIIITGPTTGVVQTQVKEIRFELKPVEEGLKGQHISVPIDTKLRRSDKLFKVVDAKEVKERR